jgi:hypothetical protein
MQYMMVPPGQHQLHPLPYPYNALEPIIRANDTVKGEKKYAFFSKRLLPRLHQAV